MVAYRRDYAKELKKPGQGVCAWAYAFSYEKRRYRKSTFRTKREAEIAEQRLRNELIANGRPLLPSGRCTFAEIRERFFRNRKLDVVEKTIGDEQYIMNRLVAHFGRRKLNEITDGDIDDYRTLRREHGLSEHSANIELTFLRNVFRFAVKHGFATRNPAENIPNFKEPRSPTKWIPEKDEFERFTTELGKTRYGWQWQVVFAVRVHTGCRPSDSLFLEWTNIDFKKDLIHFQCKPGCLLKTRNSRDVNMHPKLREILLKWKDTWAEVMERNHNRFIQKGRSKHDWVFFNPRDPTQRAKGFKKTLETARKRAGLPDFDNYTTRHLFISECLMAGIDTQTVRSWVGHKSSRMLDDVYTHLRQIHKKAKVMMVGTAEGTAVAGEWRLADPPWKKQKLKIAQSTSNDSLQATRVDAGASGQD